MTNPAPQKKLPDLPLCTLTIKDGKVQVVSERTLWNGEPWETIRIERVGPNQFRSSISDPEHGGGLATGTLVEVTRRLHVNFQAWYLYIFSLVELCQNIRIQALNQYELKFESVASVA